MLYLIENPAEYGLSRLCVIAYEEFFHTLELIHEHTREGEGEGGRCSPDFVASIEGVYLNCVWCRGALCNGCGILFCSV